MQFQITSYFRVRPEVFWGQLFFDASYNEGLYKALGFPHCELKRLDKDAEGKVHRVLRVTPLIKAPLVIRRLLEDKFSYVEEGTYCPSTLEWKFQTIPSMAAESTQIGGIIRSYPDPQGMRHVLDLTAHVTAFGLGSLFERAIESNTRESYRKTAEFTNAYAAQHGLTS